MRVLITSLLLTAGLAVAPTQAAGTISLEKTKTGILPSGGFYGLYQVTCHDQSSASVVSLERRGRWCLNYEGELSCFRRSQEASHMACASADVAVSEQDLDALDALQ
jgi:hypothetical protein